MTADSRSRVLLAIAAAMIMLQGAVLTLSPAVRERTWSADLRWSHWIGIVVWLLVFIGLELLVERALPERDLLLLPLCAVLSGLGIVTVWRLDGVFGMRQAVWLVVSAAAVSGLVRRWGDLNVLRRYRSVLLGAGLILTALTIVLGTSPTGLGPRLWLGCCGIYLQPSEPLKLLLVIYLAAYMAEQGQLRTGAFPLLLPTLLVAAVALMLLAAQRDLGSASIFIVLYTSMLYMATGRRRVLIATLVALALAAVAGFFFVGIIQARIQSWLNPWLDPSGRSYQIVQSLLSIANGGLVGRGLGIGSPSLVPVAHSDFVYSAFAEEAGLAGSIALLIVYGLLFTRGLVISARSQDRFHRLLAAGITAYLGIQSLLIIGGDLRLLPLTGVTLPFVSYGGSSLLTSAVAAAILLSISNDAVTREHSREPAAVPHGLLAAALGAGLVAAALMQTWWSVIRGPDLLTRSDNARRAIADRYVVRGTIFDRSHTPLSVTEGDSGSFRRVYVFPELSSVIGYTHPVFGQAGLEAAIDPYLRGTQGNPIGLVIWDGLLYGTPPQGLDVQLTIDARLQATADALLGDHKGAIVLMNAVSGEILVMASHPTFDANDLDAIGDTLIHDENNPLLNRAAQGIYSLQDGALPLVAAARFDDPGAELEAVYEALGFYAAPRLRLPVSSPVQGTEPADVRISPLQMAAAAATLSNHGVRPAARIALSVNTPVQSWVVLPALGTPERVFSKEAAADVANHHSVGGSAIWEWRVTASTLAQTLTWYSAGTLEGWQGSPLVVVVLLENSDITAATSIGASLLGAAARP